MIDSTAIVDPSACLGDGVSIGAYSIIEAGVEIQDNTKVGPHAIIRGRTRIGKNNRIYQFTSLGEEPQDKKYAGEASELHIGDDNVIREFCTINRGTAGGGGKTVIGSGNWIMAYVHIAHDCVVGDNTIFVNGATLGGHVHIGDYTVLGANVLVQQFCRVGRYAYATRAATLAKDLTPFTLAAGNPVKIVCLNRKGLKRHGFDDELILLLDRCYKQLVKGKPSSDSLDIHAEAERHVEVKEFLDFIKTARAGGGILR